jgi:hypothetical protein
MPRIIVCIKQALDVTELKVDSATRRIITVAHASAVAMKALISMQKQR